MRPNPTSSNPQLVLLDHGLYIQSTPEFTQEYCLFWKSLFTLDLATLDQVALKWGIPDVSLFATATLARPWNMGRSPHLPNENVVSDAFKAQSLAKVRLIEFLRNADQLPRELLFVGRNLK